MGLNLLHHMDMTQTFLVNQLHQCMDRVVATRTPRLLSTTPVQKIVIPHKELPILDTVPIWGAKHLLLNNIQEIRLMSSISLSNHLFHNKCYIDKSAINFCRDF